jgi:hypothetical protein
MPAHLTGILSQLVFMLINQVEQRRGLQHHLALGFARKLEQGFFPGVAK